MDKIYSDIGLNMERGSHTVYVDSPSSFLIEETVRRGIGKLTPEGSLVVKTGKHTGRSAKDRYANRALCCATAHKAMGTARQRTSPLLYPRRSSHWQNLYHMVRPHQDQTTCWSPSIAHKGHPRGRCKLGKGGTMGHIRIRLSQLSHLSDRYLANQRRWSRTRSPTLLHQRDGYGNYPCRV